MKAPRRDRSRLSSNAATRIAHETMTVNEEVTCIAESNGRLLVRYEFGHGTLITVLTTPLTGLLMFRNPDLKYYS